MSKTLPPSHNHHNNHTSLNGHSNGHHHNHHASNMTKALRSMSNRQPLITDFLPSVKSPISSSLSSSSGEGKSNGRCSSRIADRKKSQESEELRKKCICTGIDPTGFVIKNFGSSKGRGVVAKKTIKKGDFICEYSGDLISVKEAKVSIFMYSHQLFVLT